jgi:hypothetical protein
MKEQDIILIGRAIDGLDEAQEIVTVLVNRGVLKGSWREIASVLDSIRADLSDIENRLADDILSLGASLG